MGMIDAYAGTSSGLGALRARTLWPDRTFLDHVFLLHNLMCCYLKQILFTIYIGYDYHASYFWQPSFLPNPPGP
jgi:hypothetical protein